MSTVIDAPPVSAFQMLTRVFIRRLIDNDLASPHADRHESLALVYALAVSVAVFVTFLISTNYLAAFVQLPGDAVLSALSDRFLFIAAAMSIGALAALMVWDALTLEPRDAAILGPLPLAETTVARAKLMSLILFGAVLTIAFNTVPSVLYPLFLTLNMRGATGATIVSLVAAHAATVTLAGLFGFFSVFAAYGLLRVLLGERVFGRVSSGVQTLLVVSTVTGLLLAPTVRARDVRQWLGGEIVAPWPVRPTLWHLGLNETLAGHRIVDTPVVLPPQFAVVDFRKRQDEGGRALYRALLPRFPALARRASLSSPIVVVIAVATFFWSNRRLPDRAATPATPSRIGAAARRLAEHLTRQNPEAQAGFFFALHTLARSARHRTVLAIGVAVGLTHALIILAQTVGRSSAIGSAPPGALALGVLLLMSVMGGMTYAATMPADVAASWSFRVAWLGDDRPYLAGVKRAAIVLAAVISILLLPIEAALLEVGPALVHSALALLFAVAVLDCIFFFYRALPFACSYVPFANPKIVWPAALGALLVVTYGFANLERRAARSTPELVAFAGSIAAAALLVRRFDAAQRREPHDVNFDPRPATPTQRLGLADHVTFGD